MPLETLPLLLDGPEQAQQHLLLAHGAGAGMDHPFMSSIAKGIAAQGVRVGRFEFPYMHNTRRDGKRRPPDRMPKLLEAFQQRIHQYLQQIPANAQLFIGGKSMGGRVATLIAAGQEQPLAGVIVLGFPFHPSGKADRYRGEHLATLSTPTLILQGERDSFGNRNEIASYPLSPSIRCQFITDGDHSLVPRKRSGTSLELNLASAIHFATQFINSNSNS